MTATGYSHSPSAPSGAGSSPWAAPLGESPLLATIEVPGSKSLTNRVLVLAALARDSSRLHRPLRSRDTLLMVDALRALVLGAD